MDNTERLSINLDTGSEAVLDSICSVPIVFYDAGGHAITLYVK